MSDYKMGTVIEMDDTKFVILNVIPKDNFEYLFVTAVENDGKPWEEIKDIKQIKVDYDKLAIITHDFNNDSFQFEKDKNVLEEVYKKMFK